jgi:ribosomal protein S18 acetylase RimI-like enzyme
MIIRPVVLADYEAIWEILEPVIRAGESYALARDMPKAEALAYWIAPDRETFVAERESEILGTYFLRPNQAGGGSHIANCGYVTHAQACGQGIARQMCEHSLRHALRQSYRAMQFNFVLASNSRAVGLWQSLGFETIGRIPDAFRHPGLGFVDALIMFRPL